MPLMAQLLLGVSQDHGNGFEPQLGRSNGA